MQGGWNSIPQGQGNQGYMPQGQNLNNQQGQRQGNQSLQGFDFHRIGEMPSKYPREELPESLEGNMELGGSYQEFVYKLGDCCGNLRICVPCCCCVDYPYTQIDQSYVGIY